MTRPWPGFLMPEELRSFAVAVPFTAIFQSLQSDFKFRGEDTIPAVKSNHGTP
jgi:hypothetical protein